MMKRDQAVHGDGLQNGAGPPAPALGAETLQHLAAALKTQWKRYRKRLRRCQEKFSEAAVHASRVETRRLLSMVGLLAPFLPGKRARQIERALKQHLDTFDDLRDTQVQLQTVSELRRLFPAADLFRAHLTRCEERFARKTRKKIKRVGTRRLAQLVQCSRKDLRQQKQRCQPEEANARLLATVQNAFARTRELRTLIDPRDTATIHCTRVAFKKFRYMVEVLADYFPAANAKLLAEMHHYQTLMGDIQDSEVLLRAFDHFLCAEEVPAESAREFRAELLRRREWLIRVYLDAADQLDEFWPWPITGFPGEVGAPSGAHAREGKQVRPKAKR